MSENRTSDSHENPQARYQRLPTEAEKVEQTAAAANDFTDGTTPKTSPLKFETPQVEHSFTDDRVEPPQESIILPAQLGDELVIQTPSKKRNLLINLFFSLVQWLVFGLLTLGVIAFLSFMGLDMARGIPLQQAAGQAFGKTVTYFGHLLQGDLGLTMAGSMSLLPVSVAEVIPDMLQKSLGLLLVSLLFSVLVGVSLGLWAARRVKSEWYLGAILLSIVGISMPSFLAALLLQMGVIKLTQAAGTTVLPVGGFGWNERIILPALVLSARPLAQITRVTFVTITDIFNQDYVRTARSKGLRERDVTYIHVLRNAAIPILTTVSISLRFSLISLPVVEYIFSWPGVGFTLLKTVSLGDDNLTLPLVLSLGILFIVVNLLLDLGYGLIDPRSRANLDYIRDKRRGNLWERSKFLLSSLAGWIVELPKTWFRPPEPIPNTPLSAKNEFEGESASRPNGKFESDSRRRRRAWVKSTLGNIPFMLGGILIGSLLIIIFFSNQLAPHSPYTTLSMTIVDGEISIPPFEPSETYPWGTDVIGRDIMSLVLAGAQQTLLLASLVVLARMVVGFLLGALAGWNSGSWFDRMVVKLSEIVAAFPALLLSMILILALGIRQGMRPFIIALCFVGWGDVMQFVRSEVMNIRHQLYIESATALGLRSYQIITRHVLPILLTALISVVSLEMGGVLMLLGELGFIGIFIGGGAFAELQMWVPPYHYSDVPEWSAMLSAIRLYARSYPWTAIYPALAFFFAILGFNLFGEGIRRLIDRMGVEVTRLVANRYTLAISAVAVIGLVWARGSTGAVSFYKDQADQFNAQNAFAHIEYLSAPDLDGRALGTPGLEAAATYIADQFKALDIQPAGEKLTYFQTRSRAFEELVTPPTLSIIGTDTPLTYRQDFVEYPGHYRNLGVAQGPVHLVMMEDLTILGDWNQKIPALEDLNYEGEVILVLDQKDLRFIESIPRQGILLVADDPINLNRRFTLSNRDPHYLIYGSQNVRGQDTPILWISEDLADSLLEGTGYTVKQLREIDAGLIQDEIFELPTEKSVSMEVNGVSRDDIPAYHVIGHLPGTYAQPGEFQLDNKMIVVLVQYDNPPLSPEGDFYPGANDNASGVGMMLEIIRTMLESGYQPYKTFLFVAYSAEGLEGGEVVQPEVSKFLQTKYGFSTNFEIEAIVDLRGLGTGQGDHLQISGGGSLRLANLFESAAKRMNVPVQRESELVDLSIIFDDDALWEGSQEAPQISVRWDGWHESARTSADSLAYIDVDHLEQAGKAISLALMILGRETQY